MADVFRHASRIDGFFRKKAKNRKKIEKKGLHFPKSRDILSNVPSEQVNTTWGISTVGSALHSHCRGQRFESAMLHQTQEIRTSSQLGMGSDFFFLSEKLKIHNKKRHCGKYRFQDFNEKLKRNMSRASYGLFRISDTSRARVLCGICFLLQYCASKNLPPTRREGQMSAYFASAKAAAPEPAMRPHVNALEMVKPM